MIYLFWVAVPGAIALRKGTLTACTAYAAIWISLCTALHPLRGQIMAVQTEQAMGLVVEACGAGPFLAADVRICGTVCVLQVRFLLLCTQSARLPGAAAAERRTLFAFAWGTRAGME